MKNQDETSPSSHAGYRSVGGVETFKVSTLLVKRKGDRMDNKQPKLNKTQMRENTQNRRKVTKSDIDKTESDRMSFYREQKSELSMSSEMLLPA